MPAAVLVLVRRLLELRDRASGPERAAIEARLRQLGVDPGTGR